MDAMKVVAVVPAFRESEIIGKTVASLLSLSEIDRLVVVDDASGDSTGLCASKAGATVVVNGRNHGKGGSLNRVVPHLSFDVLLLVDGDVGDRASDALRLLEPVLEKRADLAIASFGAVSRKGGLGLAKGLGRAGIERLVDRKMETPLSGQRAMTMDVFKSVSPFAPGFGMEVAMTIDALRAGFRVVEIPVEMSHRETGRDTSGFIHRGRQFKDILAALAGRVCG